MPKLEQLHLIHGRLSHTSEIHPQRFSNLFSYDHGVQNPRVSKDASNLSRIPLGYVHKGKEKHPLVAWNKITYPYSYGGLGILPFQTTT